MLDLAEGIESCWRGATFIGSGSLQSVSSAFSFADWEKADYVPTRIRRMICMSVRREPRVLVLKGVSDVGMAGAMRGRLAL